MRTFVQSTRPFAITVLLAFVVKPGFGQSFPPPVTPDQDLGVSVNHSHHGEHEDVNLATGNVHIQLGLVDLPGRNGHDLNIALEYNSQIWHNIPSVSMVTNSQNQVGTETFWGWGAGSEGAMPMAPGWFGLGSQPTVVSDTNVQVDQETDGTGHIVHQFCTSNYRVLMPDGSVHHFPGIKTNCYWDTISGHPVVYTNQPVGDTDFRDSVWMRYDNNNGLFTANGNHWAGGNFEDTNGNLISFTGNPPTIPLTYTDTVGRTVQLTYQSGFNYPIGVVYKDPNGTAQTITLNYLPVNSFATTGAFSNPTPVASTNQPNTYAMRAMPCSTSNPCTWYAPLSSVVLPNGLTYTFHYNSTFGELDQITYPSGGYTRYDYATFQRGIRGDMNGPETPMGPWDYREVVAKHVCRAAVVPRGTLSYTAPGAVPTNTCPVAEDTTTYSPAINVYNVNNATNTVTDPLGNVTVVQFCLGTQTGPCDDFPYETKRQVYDNANHLLRTVDTTYTGTSFLKTSETVTLDNGLVTKTEWDYQTAQRLYSEPGAPGIAQVPLTVTDVTGNVTEKREFAYGQGSPGALLRKTDTAWGYGTPNAAFNNRKTSDIVYDGASPSNTVAQTTYEYDNYTQPLGSSGAIQHDPAYGTSYRTRGNITAISRWRNTDGVSLTTRYQYDDAGNRLSSTDPLGNPTSFDYTDAWASFAGSSGGSACAPSSGQTKAYLTKATDALGHTTTKTYYSCGGQDASLTDPNNQTTTFTYDLMGRELVANSPDGGKKSFDYHGDTLPLTATKTVLATPDPSILTSTVLDGLSRVSQTSLDSAPGGPDMTDVTYDALGRVATVSNPHTGTASSTDGVTQNQYDALNRITQVTKQDGSISTISYNGNCTTPTDEAGNPRRACSDALGQLIEVDEPTGGTPATPGAGSATVSGTEHSAQVLATPATSGAGSVQFSGTVQWKTVASASTAGTTNITINGTEQQKSTASTPGTGSVTVGGSEQVIAAVAATGSSTVSGSEKSLPPTSGAGNVTINGNLQSTQVQTAAATQSSAVITIVGAEQTTQLCEWDGLECIYYTGYDTGTITLVVNGYSISGEFGGGGGSGSDAPTEASYFAGVINSDPNAPITASLVSGANITIVSKAAGSSVNYSLSSSAADYDPADFGCCSFGISTPANMTGGANAVYTTVYDSGACTITINSHGDSSSFSGSATTAAAIASVLGIAINNDGSASVTASISGSTINLTSKTAGSAGNYPISSSCTYDSSHFASASFTTAGSGLSGGRNTIYDTGRVTFTANGHSDSYTYAQTDTPTTIVSALASAISGDSAAFVNATALGSNLSLTARSGGTGSDYSVSCSTTYDSTDFSSGSFAIACPTALTNGKNAIYDAGTVSVTVNSHTNSVSFNSSSTSANIASALASSLNGDTGAAVTATASGSTVALTSKTQGTIANYSLSVASTYDTTDFTHTSFPPTPSGATLTGGTASTNITDSGTMTVTVNSKPYTVNWGASSTPGSIASALATALNADTSVTPSVSGATVALNPRTAGTLYTVSTGNTYDSADFTQSSFVTANSVSDFGTSTISVNNHNDSVFWRSTDTPSSIASALASKINADSSAVVNAAASGSTVSLTARTTGTASNYTLASSISYDTAHFSSSSFGSSNSGVTLAGGTNAVYNTVYDTGTVTLTVNGTNYSASYGQNDTTTTILNNLAATINAGGLVNAEVSGNSLLLKADAGGANTNYSLAVNSSSSQPSVFPSPSFSDSDSGATLTGGTDAVAGSLASPLVTLYTYDTLGNLTCVEQHGNVTGTGCSAAPSSDATSPWRVRRFTYDSLSRLLSSSNPEANTAIVNGTPTRINSTYSYDAVGNLLQKNSPQANQNGSATTTISYCYDPVNRPLAKAYTNSPATPPQCTSTPPYLSGAAVTYTYDGGANGTNGIGRLTHLADQAGSGDYNYDPLGRIKGETRVIAGISKSMSYGYNLAGAANQLTYPSSRVVNYKYDGGGHPVSAVDVNGTQYISTATYYPGGQEYQRFMPGIYFRTDLNKRLQVGGFYSDNGKVTGYFMNKTYTYNDGHNNGDVMSIINNNDNTRTQTFTYDALNRLTSAQNTGTDCSVSLPDGHTKFWGNIYGFDAWGNLLSKTVSKCQSENMSFLASPSNQLQGLSYDSAGNMTTDNLGQNYTYDQENRITGAPGFAYTYDGRGNRLEKATTATPPTGTLYWTMAAGVVAESDVSGVLQSEYVFFDGVRVARIDLPGNAVHYYLSDQLKSTTMLVSAAGIVEDESEYYPWGGEMLYANSVPNHYKFTGKERDGESQLDYFGARYYSNGLGRFVTPDWDARPATIPYAELHDPQSLNLYSYVRNRPTVMQDPDGHLICDGKPNCSGDVTVEVDEQGNRTITIVERTFNVHTNEDGTVTGTATTTTSVTKIGAEGNVTGGSLKTETTAVKLVGTTSEGKQVYVATSPTKIHRTTFKTPGRALRSFVKMVGPNAGNYLWDRNEGDKTWFALFGKELANHKGDTALRLMDLGACVEGPIGCTVGAVHAVVDTVNEVDKIRHPEKHKPKD